MMDEKLDALSTKASAHQQSMTALQEVQGDHTRRLTRIEDTLMTVKGDIKDLKGDVKNLKKDMGTVKAGVHAILDLLNTNLAENRED